MKTILVIKRRSKNGVRTPPILIPMETDTMTGRRSMKIPVLSKKRITREPKMSVKEAGKLLAGAAALLGCLFSGMSSIGEDSPPGSSRVVDVAAAPPQEQNRTAAEILLCSSTTGAAGGVVVPPGPGGRYPGREINEEGVEKKIYLLKLDSGNPRTARCWSFREIFSPTSSR